MSDKKYSVFISSTFDDLKDERMGVLRAILQHGHFPLGMELWGAADEEQWQIIQRQIDVADYYVVLIAHRYGSLSDTGISWTEREYDYAMERGVPILGFIIDPDVVRPPQSVDKGENAERLERFKSKVKSKPISRWKNSDDLRTEVILRLGRQIQSTPRIGWIRATESVSPSAMNELARLSEENAELRLSLSQLSGHILPNCPIEVKSAGLSVTVASPPTAPDWISVSITLYTTLLLGTAPGLVDEGCSVVLCLPGGDRIGAKSTLGLTGPLVIDGPRTIYLGSNFKFSNFAETIDNQPIGIEVALRPIGFGESYRTSFQIEPDRKSFSSSDPNVPTRWTLHPEDALEWRVSDTGPSGLPLS